MFDFLKKNAAIDPTQFTGGVIKKKEVNPTNWNYSDHKSCKAVAEKSLPERFSIKDKFGKVYCQRYGNCTSNAVLACDAYYYHDPNGTWEPSTVFTYYNQRKADGALKDPDDGSNVECALEVTRKLGACNAKVWPNTKPYTKKPSKAAYANGLKGKELTKYYRVKSLLQIKKALVAGYPVAIAMAWAFDYIDENHVLNDPTDEAIEDCVSGHAVVIVGYDDEKKLFEIRNSWGEGWGDHGYGFVTYKTMKKAIWFDDSYAVVK